MGNVIEADGYEYTYDKNGNVTKIRTPEGTEISCFYDADNRLIKTEETVTEETLKVYRQAVKIEAEQKKIYSGNELECQLSLDLSESGKGFKVEILYDAERLTLSDYEVQLSGITVSDNGNGKITVVASRSLASGETDLVTLSFTAKDLVEGTAYVMVSPESTITTYTKTFPVSECSGVLVELHLPDYNGDDITDLSAYM